MGLTDNGFVHVELVEGRRDGGNLGSMLVSRVPVVGERLTLHGDDEAHALHGRMYRVTNVTHLMRRLPEPGVVVAQVWIAEDAEALEAGI